MGKAIERQDGQLFGSDYYLGLMISGIRAQRDLQLARPQDPEIERVRAGISSAAIGFIKAPQTIDLGRFLDITMEGNPFMAARIHREISLARALIARGQFEQQTPLPHTDPSAGQPTT